MSDRDETEEALDPVAVLRWPRMPPGWSGGLLLWLLLEEEDEEVDLFAEMRVDRRGTVYLVRADALPVVAAAAAELTAAESDVPIVLPAAPSMDDVPAAPPALSASEPAVPCWSPAAMPNPTVSVNGATEGYRTGPLSPAALFLARRISGGWWSSSSSSLGHMMWFGLMLIGKVA